MAIIGTTIRIQGVFTDLSGQAADLDGTPVLIIYDSNKNIVAGPFDCTRSETGTYIIDYVVPEGDGTLFLEMSGMLEDNPIISRQEIEREWDDNDGGIRRMLSDVLAEVDALKPNTYSNEQKARWLNRVEGRIQTEIYGVKNDSTGFVQHRYHELTAPTIKLLVPSPYDDIYILYLCAQIDFNREDTDGYNNAVVSYNDAFNRYAKYYLRNRVPTQRGIINVWG